ncbi:MAG: hypothetical protein K6T85_03265, partial [Gorillibacterium sp.]|nr:hypothetical protein [Gorillibacterium sp.]
MPSRTTNYFGNTVTRVVGQSYPYGPDPYWQYRFYYVYSQGVMEVEKKKWETGAYAYQNPATSPPMSTYPFELTTYQTGGTVPFVSKFYPTGEVYLRDAQFNGQTVRNSVNDTVASPLGAGWSWDIPEITYQYNQRYLNMPGGGSYQIGTNNNLVGYPWKDLTLTNDSSVVVNGKASAQVLTSLDGLKYNFAADGKLIQKADAYGNTVQFHYSNVSPYGTVLTKVIDALGNEITIAYSSTEVVATMGEKTIRYEKQLAAGTAKEVLTAAKDELNRTTRYSYNVSAASFNLLPSYYEPENNFYALLTSIEHPTGAKTEYQYAKAVRTVGRQSESEEYYRMQSREDAIYYVNGTQERKNKVTFSGADGTYGSSTTFSTTVNNGRTQTTYTYKKQYIDENTPSVYYNTTVTEQANGVQRQQQSTFDEAKRWPVPLTVTSQTTGGSVSSPVVTIRRTYDDYGNVLTETHPLDNNIQTSYTYDASTHLLASIREPVDASQVNVTDLLRNPQKSVTQQTVKEEGSGSLKQQVSYGYDRYGNITAVTIRDDTRNTVINQEYGALYQAGFPTAQRVNVTDAAGQVSVLVRQVEYDKRSGSMTRFTDGKGNATSYQYDAGDRMTKEILPDTSETTLAYDDILNKVTVTDPLGQKSVEEYNPFGEKVKETSGTATMTYGYDAYGRLIWRQDGLGHRSQTSYDTWSRITKVSYPDSNTDVTVYDDIQLTKTMTDAESNAIRETYDVIGQLSKREEVKTGGNVTLGSTLYDYAGNVIQTTDGNGSLTRYAYDILGQLTGVTDPEGRTTGYGYSLAGQLTQIQYPDGSKLQHQYDEIGREIRRIDPAGQVDTFYYDANDNQTKQIDRNGQELTYAYDNRDLLTSEVSADETIAYTYDRAGKRLSMSDGTGTTRYAYDSVQGTLTQVTLPDTRSVQYGYDVMGKRTSMIDPFGYPTAYGYDVRDRLTGVGQAVGNWEESYSYKKNGLPNTTTQGNGIQWTSSYDGVNRTGLTQTKASGAVVNAFGYSYDNNRNQTSKIENGTTYAFTYDKLDRIFTSSQLNEQYTYDTRGNRQTLQTDSAPRLTGSNYTYDDGNRLTEVRLDDGTTVTYRYNGDGLLYERTEKGETTRYYYDGTDMIAEGTVSGSGTTLKVRYVRGNGLAARIDAAGNKQYYVHNGHGDIVGLADGAGNLVNSYSYDIWGNPLTTNEQVEQPFRYSGEFWDSSTGLQYLRARWYDPSIGRFINEDAYEGDTKNPLSQNLYTYVKNNPLRYLDPTGHIEEEIKNAPIMPASYSLPRYTPKIRFTWPQIKIKFNIELKAKYEIQIPEGYKVTGNAFTTTQNAAKSVGKELGGTVSELKNGWKVEIPNGNKPIVVRIMNEGSGGRSQPYFRVSIDGKGSFTLDGKLSNDKGLTHIDMNDNYFKQIIEIVKYVYDKQDKLGV